MNRRTFLTVAGLVAAAPVARLLAESYLDVVPEIPRVPSLRIEEAGTYRLSGVVRLQAPVVEISGITNRQQITWSDRDASQPSTASFVSFESYDAPGMIPQVRVRGGRLEALSLAPVE